MITRVFIALLVLVATSGLSDCNNLKVDTRISSTMSEVIKGTTEGRKLVPITNQLKEGEARSRKLRYQITAENTPNKRSLDGPEKRSMEVNKAEVKVHLVPMQVLKGLYGMPGIDTKDLHQVPTSSGKNEAMKDLPGLRIRYTEIEIPKRKDLQTLSSKRSPLLIRLLDESNSVEGSGPESVEAANGERAVVQQPRGFSTNVHDINDLQYQNPQQHQQLYIQQSPQQPQELYQQQQYQGIEPQQHYQAQQVADAQYQTLEPQYHHQQQQILEEERQEQQNLVVEPQVKQVIVSGAHRTAEEAQPESEEHFSEVGDPNYQFSYAVRDADKGADFGHEESKSEGRTSGQYWLTLPDGRRQRVRYWADSKGFRASVHYSDP